MEIKVVPYNPEWPAAFEREAVLIKKALRGLPVVIHHIGSTSVPDLMAKPIIDMLMEVEDLQHLDTLASHMEFLGYQVMGEFGIPGRRYFRKGGDKRTHHLHTFKTGDHNLVRHIAFRDYLIAHKTIADAYAQLKVEVAQQANNDMGNYCDGKDAFVKHYEAEALKWKTSIDAHAE